MTEELQDPALLSTGHKYFVLVQSLKDLDELVAKGAVKPSQIILASEEQGVVERNSYQIIYNAKPRGGVLHYPTSY